MKLLRNLALTGLLALAAAPSWAQWLQGAGDEFNGTSLDKSYWQFNLPFPDATPPVVKNTEKPSLYNVSGGDLNLLDITAANGYNPLYRGFDPLTNGVEYANFPSVLVKSAPATGWFAETSFSFNAALQESPDYPLFGILLLKNASSWFEFQLTHFGFAAGSGASSGNFGSIVMVGPQRTDFHDSLFQNGFFFAPYAVTDSYFLRVQYYPASDAGGERVVTSRKIEGANATPWSDVATVTPTTTKDDGMGNQVPDTDAIAIVNLAKNPVGLQVGPQAGSQGETAAGTAVAFHYFHTNLTAAINPIAVSATIALDGANDLATVSTGAPLGTVKLDFFTANSATHTTPLFSKTSGIVPIAGTNTGMIAVGLIPSGKYDIGINSDKSLRTVVKNVNAMANATIPGTVTLLGGNANGDNTVNFDDFLVLLGAFGSVYDPANLTNGYDATADFNYDGTINFDDFLVLLGNFGSTSDL